MLGVTAPLVRDAPTRAYPTNSTEILQRRYIFVTGHRSWRLLCPAHGMWGQQTNVLPPQHAWLAVVHPAVLPMRAGRAGA